jgi:hypothetical protein
MSAAIEVVATEKPPRRPVSRWCQVVWITLGAVTLYLVARRLPTGTNLSHMDFRAGAGSIEFCDPANPQFMPVVAVRSPVEMTLSSAGPTTASQKVDLVLTLKTSTGKPIAPEDLLVAHTQKLHLLIIDPTLTDYQHVHPQPGQRLGEWIFSFTPKRAGLYRVFADFTPAATARGLYASADLEVKARGTGDAMETREQPPQVWTYLEQGYRFTLQPGTPQLRAGKNTELSFTVSRVDGGVVSLEPVMGAFAHLVAFDAARSGFAHLHPNETDLSSALDPHQPRLTFKLTIPRVGRYVIWSQVNLERREMAAPFWFEVLP